MKKSQLKKIAYRVALGVEFLNKEYGRSWLRKIDPERLALDSGSACVLGQLEGHFEEGERVLGIDDIRAAELGFYEDDDAEEDEYPYLTKEWKKAILELNKEHEEEKANG